MFLRSILAASAALALTGSAFAQTPPPPAPAAPPAAEAPASPEEVAIEAKATAFQGRMQTMAAEAQAAIGAAAGDQAKLLADLNALQTRYQPEADVFAAEVVEFMRGQAALLTDEAQRTQMTAGLTQAETAIKSVPSQIRASAIRAAAAPALTTPQ